MPFSKLAPRAAQVAGSQPAPHAAHRLQAQLGHASSAAASPLMARALPQPLDGVSAPQAPPLVDCSTCHTWTYLLSNTLYPPSRLAAPAPPHLAHHVREGQHGPVGVPPEQLRHDGAVGRLVPRLVTRDQAAQLGQRPVAVVLRQPGSVAVRDARGALLLGRDGAGGRGIVSWPCGVMVVVVAVEVQGPHQM